MMDSNIQDKLNASGDIPKEEFQKLLEMVADMMKNLHHEATVSAELNEMDITSEWAEEIKTWFDSPVKSSYEALQSLESSIRDMIHDQFMSFINSHADRIDKIFRVSEHQLHYAIILKEDSIDDEAVIIEFKMNYDESPVSRRFPLILSFVDSDDLEGAKLYKELSLGAGSIK